MNFDRMAMERFSSGDLEIAYLEAGDPQADVVMLVHGFASTAHVNWVYPGWVKTLREAGYRAVALDHRGHGESSKPHDTTLYTPDQMAGDVLALMDHLAIDQAHVLGYSMGARISAFLALARPDRVRSLVFGGLGSGMFDGVGDWDPIAEALLADSLDDVTHPRGRLFRAFADQTKADRKALAACIQTSRTELTSEQLARLTMPTLVAVGTKDDIGGSASALAELLPDGRSLDIPNRDHMLAVGDKVFKSAVLDFYRQQSESRQ
jgi:pimeloyl-ACP methyl ester carboxylesterase